MYFAERVNLSEDLVCKDTDIELCDKGIIN